MAQVGQKTFGRLMDSYRLTGDRAARDQMVEAHLGLVRRICRRFAHTPEPQEDLIQVGCIGLIRAVERFDPEKGRAFASFAITVENLVPSTDCRRGVPSLPRRIPLTTPGAGANLKSL